MHQTRQNITTHDLFFISKSAMFKKFRSKSKEDIDHFLNKQNLDLHLRKIQNFFYVKKKKKSDLHLRKMQISFCIRKNSDLHLRKMKISFYVRKNSDLHLRKKQISFCVKKIQIYI